MPARQWQQARDELLKAAKEATQALAARRRRLPMAKFDNSYEFSTPASPKALADLFGGRDQLVVCQFMDLGPDKLSQLHRVHQQCHRPGRAGRGSCRAGRGWVTWVTVSDMPLAQIQAYKAQMGWTLPFVSSHGTSFLADCAAATTAAARPAGSGTYWYVRETTSEPGFYYSEESWMRPDGEAWVLGGKSGGKLLKYSDQLPRGATPFQLAGNPGAMSALEGVPMETHVSVPYAWRAGQVTFRQLQHLPTNPAGLKAWLVAFNRNYDNLDGTPDPQHWAVFDSLTILVAELPAPPLVRAAAFRVIASLPNVTSLGAVNGGQGLLVSLSRHLHATLVVDPATSQVRYTLTASGTAQSPSSVSEIGWWTNHLPKAQVTGSAASNPRTGPA